MTQDSSPEALYNLEVAADWHELMIPWHIMQPSSARISEQYCTRCLQLADIPPPVTITRIGIHPVDRKPLFISHAAEGRKLSDLTWAHVYTQQVSNLLDQMIRDEIWTATLKLRFRYSNVDHLHQQKITFSLCSQGGPKMAPFFVYLITLPNINRFSKFFHCQN